jgi:hypothetical protein
MRGDVDRKMQGSERILSTSFSPQDEIAVAIQVVRCAFVWRLSVGKVTAPICGEPRIRALNSREAGSRNRRLRTDFLDVQGKNAKVLVSMLSRGQAPAGVWGSSNAVCAVKRARPVVSESKTLKTNAS